MKINRKLALFQAGLIYFAGLGAAMQYAKLAVTFDLFLTRYEDYGSLVGLLLSSVGFIGILLGVFAAIFARRIGMVRVLLGGLVLGIICSLVQSFDLGFIPMLITRAIEGLSHLAIVVAAPTLIAQIVDPKDRPIMLIIWGTFFGVSFALMGWLGRMIALTYGVHSLFLLHALWLLLALIALWLSLRRDAQRNDAMPNTILSEHLRIYLTPAIFAPAMGWLFYTFCFVSLFTLIPNLVNAEWRGFLLTFMPLMTIISSLTLGAFLQRFFPAAAIVRIGFLAAAAFLGLLLFFNGSILFALLFAGGMGLTQGASFASVPEFNSNQADIASANGGMAQMGNLGNTIGTPILLTISLQLGTSVMIAISAILLCIGCFAHWAMQQRI